MSKKTFKEDRALQKEFLKKAPNMKQSSGVFTIQREYATYKIDDSFPYHYHDWYELYYLHNGTGTFRLAKKEFHIKDGVWLFAPCGIAHKIIYTSDSHERTLIYFSKEYISPSLFGQLSNMSNGPVYVADKNASDELVSLLEKLQSEFNKPDIFSTKMYKYLLYEIVVGLIRNSNGIPSVQGERDLLINHITDYVSLNYNNRIMLEDLAELNDVSACYLSRKFKQLTGMTFCYYLNSVRIENAKKMLLETDLSVSMISEKCGFNDSNYFSCVFKSFEGVSPLKYRNMSL